MAFGDFISGGAVNGIMRVEDHTQRQRMHGIFNEQAAAATRQQQDQEAATRRANQMMDQFQIQPGLQPLPNAVMGNSIPNGPQPRTDLPQASYSNEGRSVPTPKPALPAQNFSTERQAYADALQGVTSNIAAIDASRAPRPAGPTVDDGAGGVYTPETGRTFLMTPEQSQQYRDLKAQKAGLEQGIKNYDEAKALQSKPTTGAPAAAQNKPSQFDSLFEAAGKKYGVDPQVLKRLAITESSLNPQAVNKGDGNGGSFGLMQINGQHFNGQLTPQQIMDPATNVDYGARIFAQALKQAGGDVAKATQIYKGAVSTGGQSRVAGAVNFVAGGAQQPAQQAQTPTQQPFAPQGNTQLVGGPNIDKALEQQGRMIQLLQMQAQGTRDVGQKAQLLMQAQQLQYGMQDTQLKQLAHQAQFNPQALQQLVGLFAGQAGTQLGVQQDAQGNVRLVGANGQPVPGQWGQPMPAATLVSAMHSNLSQGLSAAQAQIAALYQKHMAEAGGKAAGEAPYKQAELRQQGANIANAHMIAGEYGLQQKLLEHGLSADEIKGATFNPNAADGTMEVHTKRGAFLYKPGGTDPKTGIKTEGQLTPIMISGTPGLNVTGFTPHG